MLSSLFSWCSKYTMVLNPEKSHFYTPVLQIPIATTVIQVFSIFCRYLLSLKSLFNAFSYSLPAVNLSTDAVSKQSLQWVISGYQIGQVQSSSPFPLVPLIPLYTTHTPVFKTKSLLFVPEIFLPLCTLQLVYNYKVCPNIALSKNLWQLLRWWQV